MAARPATPEQWKQILADARKEGRVVMYNSAVPVVQERLKADFEKAVPGITLEFVRYGSGQLVTNSPMPDERTMPSPALSQATKSLRSFAGTSFRATIHSGVSAISEMGSKSFTTS